MVNVNGYYDNLLAKTVTMDVRSDVLLKMIELDCTTEQRDAVDKIFKEFANKYDERMRTK